MLLQEVAPRHCTMDTLTQTDKSHLAFMYLAKEQGLAINGVRPALISQRGVGIVAERPIRTGEEIVRVPTAALLTTDCILQSFKDKYEGLTVHGLLAAFLASWDGSESLFYAAWKMTWPATIDFERSMPILWKKDLLKSACTGAKLNGFHVLPPAVGGWRGDLPAMFRGSSLLESQKQKLKADWSIVSKVSPVTGYDDYVYAWLIVNTRSFYYDLPLRLKPQCREDRMVLCPFADFFNHSSYGVGGLPPT